MEYIIITIEKANKIFIFQKFYFVTETVVGVYIPPVIN